MVHKTQNMLAYLSLPTHSGLELVLKLFSRPFEGQNQQPMKNRFTKQYNYTGISFVRHFNSGKPTDSRDRAHYQNLLRKIKMSEEKKVKTH